MVEIVPLIKDAFSPDCATFLGSLLLGGGLALIYDIMRAWRRAFGLGAIIIGIQDVLFLVLCAWSAFALILYGLDGHIRWYALAGMALGAALYLLTASMAVLTLFTRLLSLFAAAMAIISGRVRDASRSVGRLFRRGASAPAQKFKKVIKKRKNCLKDPRNNV